MLTENKFSITGSMVWVVCALFFLFEFMMRTVLGTFQPQIMEDFQLNLFRFSLLSTSIFLVVYSLMQIPVGILVYKIGLKVSLIIAVSISFLACFLFAISSSYTVAVIARMLMGLGGSFAFICLAFAIYDWLPHKHFGLLIGVSQFLGVMGAMFASGPLNSIVEKSNLTWRSLFLYMSIVAIIQLALVIIYVKNNVKKSGNYKVLRRYRPIKYNIRRLFFRNQPWLIGIYTALIYFSIEYLSENEGRNLVMGKGFTQNFAAYCISIGWLGYAIGCPLLGYISDLFQRRKPVMILAGIFYVIAITIMLFADQKLLTLISWFLLGFGSSGQTIGFALISEQFDQASISIGIGLNNALLNFTCAVNAPLIGFAIDNLRDDVSTETVIFYTLLSVALLAITVSFFFIKESFCKSQDQLTVLSPYR